MKANNGRHTKNGLRARTATVRRVVVELTMPLFDRAERATRELSINRSELIRRAVERFIEALHRKDLARELAEGYQANSGLDQAIAGEFQAVDYEAF